MFPFAGKFPEALRRLGAAGLFALLALVATPVFAQDVDPPGRAARLADAEGQVWIYTPQSGDWIAAQRNQVLTAGDRLATDGGARAELQIGSTTVRLDGGSELGVQQLDDDHLVLQLQEGTVIARLRDPAAAGQFEVDTDDGRIVALRGGALRIARVEGRTDLTVYTGEARYEGPNSALPLEAGQRAQFWIDASGAAQYSTLPPANDAFLAWSADRDRRESAVVAERYVSPEMTGAADLDAYGRWEQNDDYGPLWVPVVSADWAPYSQGHWAWVAPWGWTWIDDAPWGFAPFHYGRWVHVRDNWCWTPGSRVSRPVYAPALVGWVGGPRGNLSVTVGGGPAVGWVPLAPREVYVPSYRVSPRYAERLNISYVGNAGAIRAVFGNPQGPRDFENRRFPRAITVVPAEVLTERRPVGPAAAQYRQTPWVRDLANGPGRVASLMAPPVAAPPPAARGQDARAVRPPPGFPVRPAFESRPAPAPAPSPRDRSPNERDRGGRESHDLMRPGRPIAQPTPAPQPPQAGVPPLPANVGQPSYPSNVGQPPYPTHAGQMPSATGQARIVRPPVDTYPGGDPNRRFERPGTPPRPPGFREGNSGQAPGAGPTVPAQSATPTQQALPVRPQVSPLAPQEGPNMRALPVYRGEDRRGEERRPQMPQTQQAPQVQQAPPVVRPPSENPRPAPMPVSPPPVRPTPGPAPMPAAPPQVRPAQAAPAQAQPQEPRRGDPREQQR